MVLREVVHPLFEYTPKPADVVTVPLVDKVEDALRAAKVVNVKAIPIMTNATIAVVIESFGFVIMFPNKINPCVLSLNKHYCTLEQRGYLNNTDT
jgi:hypothetical protein